LIWVFTVSSEIASARPIWALLAPVRNWASTSL
jgi:hypothetical protein